MKLVPFENRIVVEVDKPETTTASGIILSSQPKEVFTGKVIASSVEEIPVGKSVLFEKYTGIKFNNQLILQKQDIVAFLEA